MSYIYHYTSLETLALIFKTQSIALSKLSMLDDPLEKYIFIDDSLKNLNLNDDKVKLGDYCYVSSWTKSSDESISMWDMYGDRKQGVRIGMPDSLLNSEFDIYNFYSKRNIKPLFEKTEKKVIPDLIDVVYGDLKTNALKINESPFSKLGKFKISEWGFQKECRFRLFAYKTAVSDVYFSDEELNNSICISGPIDRNRIFFGIRKDAFSEMSIVRGPLMSEGKRELLNCLIETYKIDTNKVCNSMFTSPK